MDVGFLVSLVLFLMSVLGGGIPLGIPPEEDPLLTQLAPEECLYYTTWAGMGVPDPHGLNEAEQLVAEPDLRELVTRVEGRITQGLLAMAERGDPSAEWLARSLPMLLRTLVSCPTAIYVTAARWDPVAPDLHGAMIVNLGENREPVEAAIEGLRKLLPAEPQAVEIEEASFDRLQLNPQLPPVTWGIHEQYFLLGVGEGAVQQLLHQATTPTPQWLADLRDNSRIDRLSSLTHADLSGILRTAPASQSPDMQAELREMGLGNLGIYTALTGLSETRFVSRSEIGIDGAPEGFLAVLDGKPLARTDLRTIPDDALLGVALRIDPRRLLAATVRLFGWVFYFGMDIEEDFDEGMRQAELELGFHLRDDLMDSLGDVWTLYATRGDGGLITSWTLTATVEDQAELVQIQQQIVAYARATGEQDGSAPKIQATPVGDFTMYSMIVPDDDFWMAPSWCLTDTHVVFSLYPQPVMSFLRRTPQSPSLADAEQVAAWFGPDPAPVALVYQDTGGIIETLYPLLQIGTAMITEEFYDERIELDLTLLPPSTLLSKHLRPSQLAIRRTDAGLVFESAQSHPGGTLGTLAPVLTAAALPAIGSARRAAVRAESLNHLRQIAIALHNYHDAHGAFPAAYNTDANGQPLLSWRVHLLPFLEGQELYEQFHLDEPWDSPHNRKLIRQMPDVFHASGSESDPGKTNYLGIRGEGSVMQPPPRDQRGRTYPTGVQFADILDGTSNTLVVVEASDQLAVIWTKPDDFIPDETDPVKGLAGLRAGDFLGLLCDGSVSAFSASTNPEMLKRLFHLSDGEPIELP